MWVASKSLAEFDDPQTDRIRHLEQDFGYGVSSELGNGTVSQEFYGLADQHGMNQMFYNER